MPYIANPLEGIPLVNTFITDQVSLGAAAASDDTLIIYDLSATALKQLTIANLQAGVLVSPALTGTPTAPTQSAGNDTTRIATTAFVTAAGTIINTNANNRIITGSGTAGTLNGESNLTFSGSTLALTGSMTASSTVTASSFITEPDGPLKLVGDNNNFITIIASSSAHSQNRAYTWPSQDGANNTVMVTNGGGSMTWEVINAGWIGTGTLAVARGGTGTNTFTANGILVGNSTSAVAVTATMATKGHVMIGDGSGVPSMLAIGSNDQVLTADSGEATGVKWAAVAAGGLSLEMTLVLGS